MREIASPLDGIRSPFGQLTSPLAIYSVLGFKPKLVLDFDDERYFDPMATSTTFSDALTHSASSNATMVDSDGLLKWRPHNLALNSATPATQSITVVSGADYTVECTGVSIALSGAGTGTVTEGNPVTITASTTTLTLTVTGSTGTMWAYRSDLGGMVNNPDTGNSYVPTTSAARYLPRRGHHVWNGSAWVNEGLLHESEARTNLLTYSEDFTNPAWTKTGITLTANSAVSPSGETDATKFKHSAAIGQMTADGAVASGASATFSVFVKPIVTGFVRILISNDLVTNSCGGWFNLSTLSWGTVNSVGTAVFESTHVEQVGDYYRIAITGNIPGTTPYRAWVYLSDADNSVTRSTTPEVYLYGAQFEEGSTPSSYIPTSGSTVTRAAETLTIPAAKLPWPTPNVIGDEVWSGNWGVESGTGWAISGSSATHTEATGSGAILRSLTVTPGVYRVSYSVAGDPVDGNASVNTSIQVFDSSTLRAGVGNLFFGPEYTLFDGSTTYELIAVINSTTLTLRSFSDDNFEITGVSVREIDPLAVSIQMQGRATGNTYTTTRWSLDASNEILQQIGTTNFTFTQEAAGVVDTVTGGSFTSGVNTPFNFASTHASTLVAAAVGGTALTDNTTPVALPNLSATNLNLGHSFMGTLKLMRVWSADITEAGREEAST